MNKKIKFKLQLTDSTLFDSSKINKKTIIFFYPKAMTSGCSIEVEDFQKKLSTFKKFGFDVIGASKENILELIDQHLLLMLKVKLFIHGQK
jgi:peroxiredoxin